MVHLRGIEIRSERWPQPPTFPFDVLAIRSSLDRPVGFDSSVTFLVGESGSGTSTFLVRIACAAGLPGIGSDDPSTDATLASGRKLEAATTLR